jgi:ankyrin repeat protein
VDPETGDNVWHALARLALPRNFLLSSIQDYLWKDVDLNLPNNNGEYPLITFIRSRPKPEDDETDAQRSKYLETLMWKDSRPYIRIPSQINVNIRDRSGASALYHAVIRGQSDSVRSLIERGANVNARLGKQISAIHLPFISSRFPSKQCLLAFVLAGDQPTSILQATMNARDAALLENDPVKMDRFKNIIDYLRDEKAVMDPTIEQERQWRHKSLMRLPM